jgi:hypothetical protein
MGARLAVTIVGVAVGAGASTPSRLSRYPTRTATAVPGHVHSRLRRLPAATSLPWALGEPLAQIGVDGVGGRAGPWAKRVVGLDVGGQGRWRR